MNTTDNSLLTKLGTGIQSGTLNQVRHILNNLSPPDIAHQLETAPPRSRHVLWQLVDSDIIGEVLTLSDDIQRIPHPDGRRRGCLGYRGAGCG